MSSVAEKEIPSLSIVFPVHNEEAILAPVLMNALEMAEEYPSDVEIIVACNGCTDRSAQIARLYPVTVIDDERCGMSFGNNLGGRAATNDLIFFWDADTILERGALLDLAEAVAGKKCVAGGFAALPDKVYPRSVIFYHIMNVFCRIKKMPAAGIVFMSNAIYNEIDGFDETIPQGTGSDVVRRACEAGAEFLFVDTRRCRTSVRRFEKRGYLRQLLDWRRNIKCHSSDQKEEITKHDYEVIR